MQIKTFQNISMTIIGLLMLMNLYFFLNPSFDLFTRFFGGMGFFILSGISALFSYIYLNKMQKS